MGVEPTAARSARPATGFEDRGSHRAPTTPKLVKDNAIRGIRQVDCQLRGWRWPMVADSNLCRGQLVPFPERVHQVPRPQFEGAIALDSYR
jgi:hypothetical protein